MRNLFAYSILFSFIALSGSLAQEKKAPTPPSKLVFEAKNGKVTYDHAAHAKREKNDCKMCHPVPFAQDAEASLNYKSAMHKAAEEKHASCGLCHYEGRQGIRDEGQLHG